MKQDFPKKYLQKLWRLSGQIFYLVGFLLTILESHSAPFVFKPFVFKPTIFKPAPFKAPVFRSPFISHPVAAARKPITPPASPKKDVHECNECLGKVLHIVDQGDFLTQAQCYECITSACPEASTPEASKMKGNEKYIQCKASIGGGPQPNLTDAWKVK